MKLAPVNLGAFLPIEATVGRIGGPHQNTMRRRIVALLFGALAALAMSVVPAGAATPPSGARAPTGNSGPSAPAIGADVLTVAPAPGASTAPGGGFAMTLDAGASKNQALVVTNHSTDRRLTVRIVPVDATRVGNDTHFSDHASDTGAGSWIAASIGEVVIEPNSNAIVPLTIAVPDAAAAGDQRFAGLQVFAVRADSTANAAPVLDHLPSVSVPIGITIAGNAAAQLAVTHVQAALQHNRAFLQITLQNSGALAADASGSVKAVVTGSEQAINVIVAAHKTRTVTVDWAAFGTAPSSDVDIELAYGDNNASWIGTVAAPDGLKTTATSAPNGSPSLTPAATSAPKSSGLKHWLSLIAIVLVALLMLGAGGFLVRELMRPTQSVSGTRFPLDIGSLPPLHVMMDPAHTDVLNALVAQVAVLAAVIERLAERLGIQVPLPPGPALLAPVTGSRRRRRRASECAPPVPVSEPVVSILEPEDEEELAVEPEPEPEVEFEFEVEREPAPEPEPEPELEPVAEAPPPEPQPVPQREPQPPPPLAVEHEEIAAATEAVMAPPPRSRLQVKTLFPSKSAPASPAAPTSSRAPEPDLELPVTAPPPTFIAPPAVDEDAWPTDEQVEEFLARRGD
ncbi:MAG: hypothetical protein JWL83_4551, partial [Actinomycetia bacterium]|nr:hypothetical protein [Actinomycetes bacterium]